MAVHLNASAEHRKSGERLAELYREGLIANEKKPFIIDLEKSSGPYLAIHDDDVVLLDAASQIATVGLGLNHGSLFGAVQHLSSWIDDANSPAFRELKSAYVALLQRLFGSKDHSVSFCNSGAEAIERALAACFERRNEASADRVLAFEGSFHGRTKFALEATWSPGKREPFSWTEQAAIFAPYPESDTVESESDSLPTGWEAIWSDRDDTTLGQRLESLKAVGDDVLLREVESLTSVRQSLRSKRCFAILIEPMQSEGGDRYSTRRFHQGLAALARTFAIPLIYDEIQTGFHLGKRFFWHQQFGLTHAGQPYLPDIVIAAKKAQVGVIISRFDIDIHQGDCPASMARGYVQASLLDQFGDEIGKIEEIVRSHLDQLIRSHSTMISRPRGQGLAFAFDFADGVAMQRAVAARFQFGLAFYPAGDRTIRFRLNLSFGESALVQLFTQLDTLLQSLRESSAKPATPGFDIPSPARHYAFHERFIDEKLRVLRGESRIEETEVRSLLTAQLRSSGLTDPAISVRLLDQRSYPQYRDRILQIQRDVYEPARQTSGADFDRVFSTDRPLAIVVEMAGSIIGMAFAGPLKLFQFVRGVDTDPLRNDDDAAYMVDATVTEPYRGKLGRMLKQAIVLLAMAKGYRTIHGRNRDRLARSMWAINVSFGATVSNHLENGYDDQEPYRDCLYYHFPIAWELPSLNLSQGIVAPLGLGQLTSEFVSRNLPKAINKLTLSNFVDADFIEDLRRSFELFPVELRHGYSASSLSEAVDKIVKSLWLSRAPRKRLLAFRNHFFGDGTMLARSLSGIGQARYEVQWLDPPHDRDDRVALDSLQRALAEAKTLALFIEPLPSRTMAAISREVLQRVREMCTESAVPLVYNESAAMFFRYSEVSFSAGGERELEPDAVVVGLGGQMALSLLRKTLFANEPLKMISTWDGDGFSLAKFFASAQSVTCDIASTSRLQKQFVQSLTRRFLHGSPLSFELRHGCGWIEGDLPKELAELLERSATGRWLVCPSPSAMRQFVEQFGVE